MATPGDVAFLPPFARASRKGAPPLKNDFAFSFPFPYAGAPVLQFPFSRGCFVCCSLLRRPFVPCLFRLPNSAFRSVLPVGSRESRQGSRVGKEQHSLPWLRERGGEDHCLIGITKGCPAYTPKEGMTEQRYSALLCRRKASYSPTRTTALVFFQFGRHHYRDPSENKVQRSPKKKEKKEKRPVCPLTLRREWRQHGRC